MKNKRGILWFRSDLRLHDNEALYDALQVTDELIPVYVLDPRVVESKTKWGFDKTGHHRYQFILESLVQLRQNLIDSGSNLVIRTGLPEEVLFDLAKEYKTNWVFCNRERTQEETEVQDRLETNLWSIGQELRYSRGKMLYYTQDLPFPITQTPDSFSSFRKEVDKIVPIRETLPTDRMSLKPLLDDIELGEIPTIPDKSEGDNAHLSCFFSGGENSGIERVERFISEFIQSKTVKTSLSPYLSQGCISPKYLYSKITNIEIKSKKKEVEELVRNLQLRDYHRLIAKKYTNDIFIFTGLTDKEPPSDDFTVEKVNAWISGNTDNTYVNACMKKLAGTGFLTNYQRRVVSYYFIYVLAQNWQVGASYFESILIDYDPCSNYGNWQRSAGISIDQKGEKEINFSLLTEKHNLEEEGLSYWLNQEVSSSLTL